jgi:AraC family ethanolamine operon transcriptional activator
VWSRTEFGVLVRHQRNAASPRISPCNYRIGAKIDVTDVSNYPISINAYHGGLDGLRAGGDTELLSMSDDPVTVRDVVVETPHLRVINIVVSGASMRRGAIPKDTLTFGFTTPCAAPNHWCGEIDNGRALLAFPREEFVAVTMGHFEGTLVSIRPPLIESATELLEVDASPNSRARLLDIPLDLLAGLRAQTQRFLAASTDLMSHDPALIQGLAIDLGTEFLVAIAQSRPRRRSRAATRHKAFERARRFIESNAGEPLTLQDICRSAAVSARTLQYAFRDHASLTPQAYLKRYRLNRAYRDLQTAAAGTLVADVANRWGFWHMGQFAIDFRQSFGKLPRQVLGAN